MTQYLFNELLIKTRFSKDIYNIIKIFSLKIIAFVNEPQAS
jgi:hypothetical protein